MAEAAGAPGVGTKVIQINRMNRSGNAYRRASWWRRFDLGGWYGVVR